MHLTVFPRLPHPTQSLHRTLVLLSFAALLLLSTVALLEQGKAVAQSGFDTGFGSRGTTSVTLTARAVGAPLPRVQCASGYSATIYAQGLSSPDGLAFSPAGVLHVAEETAGRVSQIGPGGNLTPVITGLTSPEGIAFDDAGNLYAVEDTQAGRLIKRASTGVTTTLATDLDAPEGVVWAADTFYVTESNIESASLLDFRTRVAAISSSGLVTRIVTNTPIIHGSHMTFWSYAGLTLGPDGLLYVTNEISGEEIQTVVVPDVLTFTLFTTDSVFTVDPATGARTLFAGNLVSPEGLCFSTGGEFPLYVVEEEVGGGNGRLSRVASDGSHTPLCTGFFSIEDVAIDRKGWLYVSEDTTGLVILIKSNHQVWLPLILRWE
jgi:sugar lactone lactonase YvrE